MFDVCVLIEYKIQEMVIVKLYIILSMYVGTVSIISHLAWMEFRMRQSIYNEYEPVLLNSTSTSPVNDGLTVLEPRLDESLLGDGTDGTVENDRGITNDINEWTVAAIWDCSSARMGPLETDL